MAQTETMMEVHPATVWPVQCTMRKYSSIKMLTAKINSPRPVIKRMGLMENDVTPSKAKLSIFFEGVFDAGKALAALVFYDPGGKPTSGTRPRKKRLSSHTANSPSTRRLIRR